MLQPKGRVWRTQASAPIQLPNAKVFHGLIPIFLDEGTSLSGRPIGQECVQAATLGS